MALDILNISSFSIASPNRLCSLTQAFPSAVGLSEFPSSKSGLFLFAVIVRSGKSLQILVGILGLFIDIHGFVWLDLVDIIL